MSDLAITVIALVICTFIMAHVVAFVQELWWTIPEQWQWWNTHRRIWGWLLVVPVTLVLPFILLLALVLWVGYPKDIINKDEWQV